MGFFGGSKKTNVPATGYYSLPGDLRQQYNNFYNSIPNATQASNFTLPEFNEFQNQAFSNIQQAANPNSTDISALVNTYMNPYNDAVLNQINTQANGQNSILKQTQAANGQIGSNRGVLQANDIDMQRLNQQQGFLQGQFNNSLQTGLQQQQLGINNLMNAGSTIQQQQYQNQLAPYQALQAQSGLLNPAAQFIGGSTPAYSVKTGGGLGGLLNSVSGLAQVGSGFFGAGAGLGAGAGWWGGLDPSTGITWNSGRLA